MSGSGKKEKGKGEDGREARLAAALRANLARRRQQKRSRAGEKAGEQDAAPENSTSSDSHK